MSSSSREWQLAQPTQPTQPSLVRRLARREALTHGALPWIAAHQRRTLLYRYAERGFSAGSNDIADYAPFYDSMSPLAQAILEPAHYNNRPGIADLLAEQEGASA